MKKSKSKLKAHDIIKQDDDGSFFCLKCGQAGFKTIHHGYGHLNVCKGYDAVVQETKEKLREIENLGGVERSHTQHLFEYDDDVADSQLSEEETVPPQSTNRVGNVGGGGGGGGSTHPTPPRSPSFSEEKRVRKLIEQNAMLAAKVQVLEKTAFNHNQHVQLLPRQNFSGPQDMVNSTFGELMENKTIRMIVTLGALAVVLNFVMDQFDKLDKRSKNRKK